VPSRSQATFATNRDKRSALPASARLRHARNAGPARVAHRAGTVCLAARPRRCAHAHHDSWLAPALTHARCAGLCWHLQAAQVELAEFEAQASRDMNAYLPFQGLYQ
jgi:hypothetical protein